MSAGGTPAPPVHGKCWAILCAGVLVSWLAPAQSPETAAVEPAAAPAPTVAGLLEPLLRQHDLPALAAAVVTSRGLEAIGAVGVRKRGTEVAVSTNDLWHLGSDTKAMTATLVGKWVDRGKLTWETTPAEVFPELASDFHADYRGVTLRHLLAHRAGVEANLNWARLARNGTVREQRLEAVRQALAAKPKDAPGSAYAYSNLGYVVAGAMVERISGVSWEEGMRTEIFAPLGMTRAGFGGLGTPGEIDQPWGHASGGEPVRNNGPAVDNPPVLGPAGTVHAPLEDWARFVADHLRGLRGEPGLLQPATYRTLVDPSLGGDYALGWRAVERSWGGGTVLNHCGCNTMFYANAWLAPARDFAVLVCANQGLDAFPATDEAVGALVEWWLARKP